MRKLTMLVAAAAVVSVGSPSFGPLQAQATEAQAAPQNIVKTAAAAGNFTMLAKALESVGLTQTLSESGPFTVFAPTDEAFAALPKATLDSLMNDKEALQRVLLTHVISGEISGSNAMQMAGASTETASGVRAQIVVRDGKLRINEATVTQPDILASNGIIHVIDRVIIPINESHFDPR